jgi:alpha-2-macroglobulin
MAVAIVAAMIARWLLVVALLGSFGCRGKAGAPPGQGRSLSVAPLPEAEPKSGPVQVTYYAPRGETSGKVEIAVAFDRPMVALGSEASAQGAIELTPHVAGQPRWVGSQTLLFEPQAPLPMGTEFSVRVPRALRALDGRELAEDFRYTFGTPAPTLVRSDPADAAQGQDRKRALELYFNQPVDVAAVQAQSAVELVLESGAGAQHPFSFERPDPSDARRVRVVPKRALPLGATVVFTLRAGLVGMEGPRPLAGDVVTRFGVYGPLRVLPPRCDSEWCEAALVFSNPVNVGRVFAALTLTPAPSTPLPRDLDYESTTVYLGASLTPGATYRAELAPGLRDVYGNALTGTRSVQVTAPPLPSQARLLLAGELNPELGPARLRVQLANVRGARLELAPLAFEELAPLAPEAIAPRARAKVHALGDVGVHERRVAEVDIAGSGARVFLATVIAQGEGEELRTRRLLAFTDLAATLKATERGGLVSVTRLSDAQPVGAARVRVMRGETLLASGTTDAAGLFRYQHDGSADDGYEDVAAVVEKQGDISFVRKYEGVAPYQLTDNASSLASGPVVAHLFTERGIYRPGDTLQLKGILRTSGANGFAPTAGEVELTVRDSADREIERTQVALSAFGTFARTVRIPGSVPLGPLALDVVHGGQHFTTTAEVAEYRPAELEAALAFEAEHYVRGDRAKAQLSASFLFGAKPSGASVFWTARSSPRSFANERFAGFTFRDESGWDAHEVGLVLGGETKLDEDGRAPIEVALEQAQISGPSYLELEATVSASGAEVATRTRAELAPAAVLAGLQAASVSESGKALRLELVALSSQGEPALDVPLEAKLFHRTFATRMVDGRAERAEHDELVGSCKKRSQREPVRCAMTPKKAGLYIAEVRARDAQGRESMAALRLYVYGGAASWGAEDGTTIELQSARTSYALGETARVLVPSPFADAEALVTVEREGVLSVERTRLGSAGTLDVRIDERFVPNAFVSVLLIRPRTQSTESGLDYRVGAIELSADVSARKLHVAVEPDSTEKRPGEQVNLKLSVRDGLGKPVAAELAVYAVDEGVLALTAYATPDPFATLYAHRPLAVWTSDSRGNLARRRGEDEDEEKGGDEGGGGGQLVRQNFAAVAFFQPRVETDTSGRAQLAFTLPDGTTRYRIMAVAASRGVEVGSGEAFVRTSKPLFLRPLLPAVLHAGDVLTAHVAVHNERDRASEVEVTLAAEGLDLAGPRTAKVRVEPRRAAEVQFALRAPRVGRAQLRFEVRGGGERDAIAVVREVLSPSRMETVSVSGNTSAARVAEQLAPLAGLRTDLGGLSVILSSSVLSDFVAPARSLADYAYGCTEQLASRLVALAALERLRRPLGLKEPFAAQAAPLLAELERHQRDDGSFALWRADDGTKGALSAFLTGYVLVALDQLKRAGIEAAPHTRERALAYLGAYLRSSERGALRDADRAFVLYALARSGAYDASYGATLHERAVELPPFAQIELAHALLSDPARRGHADGLLTQLAQHVRVTADEAHVESNAGDDYAPLLMSDVRATAELVLLLLERDPEHVLLPKLVRWLVSARGRDGTWATTQASAWALMAAAEFHARREAGGGPLRTKVTIGDREPLIAELSAARSQSSFVLPMRELPRDGDAIELEKRGAGTLHYTLRFSYARSELPTTSSERGFFLERSYEHLDPAAFARGEPFLPGPAARRGDYVRVTLRVAVPATRRFVMLHEATPAGLAPVDFSLATSAQNAAEALGSAGPYDHHELREGRVLFAVNQLEPGLYRHRYLARASSAGTFVAPSATVFEMYRPETAGTTAAQRFEVSP